MTNQNNQNQIVINFNLNSNQEGVEAMNSNLKNFKMYDENDEKVELHLYFIDGAERIFDDYVWVPKTAITDNGIDEVVKKDIEKDVACERKRESVCLFWVEENKVKSEDDDDDDDSNLNFFIIG